MISARLSRAGDGDYYRLALMLEGFLTRERRDREALQLLDSVIERYPDDVRASLRKADRLLYFAGDLEGALKSIDVTLERAHRRGCFRREALGCKARILVKLGRGEELSRVLEEIMALEIMKDVPDVGPERDFVDRAPPGLIRADVLARYNEFRPKRATDTDADEPPEWNHPTMPSEIGLWWPSEALRPPSEAG